MSRRNNEEKVVENFMRTEVLEEGREGHGWAEETCEEEEQDLHRGRDTARASSSRQYRSF